MGKKFIDFPGGQVKTQTKRPSRALNLDMCVASGTAGKDTVTYGKLGGC